MDCRITCSKSQTRFRNAGVSLAEFMIGLGVGSLVIAATCAFSIFSARTFVSYMTESGLDMQNRSAFDIMNRDLRSVVGITNYNSSQDITFVDWDNTLIRYLYDPARQTFSRIKGSKTAVLLKDCSRFSMRMDMRNMTNATFWCYSTTNTTEAKVLTVNWCCSRKVLGTVSDSMPQYAVIAMRAKN